jgi:hypothetical protein
MAEEKIIFTVVADYDKAIKEWEQLRDKVASTTEEYKEAQVEINRLKQAKGELTGETFKTKEALQKEKEALKKSNDEYKRRQKELNNTFKAQAKQGRSVKSLTKAQVKQSDATGSATAATMELSRVVSDAPYGIRGMANNITQLVSQLGTASTKAGGLGSALKLMGTQLMGPLGIVFAITAAVSALDYFYGANKKAEEGISNVDEALKKKILTLNTLNDALTDSYNIYIKSNSVLKEREGLLGLMSETDKELAKILKDTNSSESERNENIAKHIKSLEAQYKKKQLVAKLDNEIKNTEEDLSILRNLANENKGTQAYWKFITLIDEIELSRSNILKEILETQEKINKLNSTNENKEDRELGELGRLTKELSLKKKLRETLSNDKREYEAYTIVIEGLQKRIDKIRGTVKDRDKVIGLDLDSIGIGEEAKKGKKMLKAVADAMGIDMKKDPLEIDANLDLTLSPEAKKAASDALKAQVDEMVRQSELEDLASYAEKAKEIIGGMGDFANAEFDRELTIEQNKTNALNNELNIRLQNENLSKEQRQSIQNQIAQNDEKLRVKQEQIERKRFTMQKAVNIAQATMDTFVAATGVLADTEGGSFARIAGMVATIGAGLAQVAAIARQKFQTSAGSSPRPATGSSSGGGSGRAEPSFNIVGRSGDSLLINAIQAQFGKPLKAYVVSREVTNQQQLDGIIVNQAST